MRRWLGWVLLLGLMVGGLVACEDVGDFFDSGFADDDNNGDDDDDNGNDGQGTLSRDNLAGRWTLDLEDSNTDEHFATMITENTLRGIWDVDDSIATDSDFLAPLIPNFDSVASLEITTTTTPRSFIFRNASNGLVAQFTWEFTSTGAITLTTPGGSEELQATLTAEGMTLTLTQEGEGDEEDRQAVFDIRDNVATITSYRLEIDGDAETFTTTITFRNNGTDTFEEDFTIVDNDTIRLSRNGEDVDVQAVLSSNNDALTLTFPSSDGRGTAEFRQ